MATTRIADAPMKVAQISKPGADFEIVERAIPRPGTGQVRIRVQVSAPSATAKRVGYMQPNASLIVPPSCPVL